MNLFKKESEIDLLELFKFLWNGKFVIIIVTIISIVIGHNYIANLVKYYDAKIEYNLKIISNVNFLTCEKEVSPWNCYHQESFKYLKLHLPKGLKIKVVKPGIIHFQTSKEEFNETITQLDKANKKYAIVLLKNTKDELEDLIKVKKSNISNRGLLKEISFLHYNSLQIIKKIEQRNFQPYIFLNKEIIELQNINKTIYIIFIIIGLMIGTILILIKSMIDRKKFNN